MSTSIYVGATGGKEGESVTPLDKQMLRNEFLRIMQHRFLTGQDHMHFNYK